MLKMLEVVKRAVNDGVERLTDGELEKWFTRTTVLTGRPELFTQNGGKRDYAEAVQLLEALGMEKIKRSQAAIISAASRILGEE